MAAWFATDIADFRALRASWATVRGGWGAARQDAAEMVEHRRILVETPATRRDGTIEPVLRTRLRLDGDMQTDVSGGWLAENPPDAIAATTQAHFASVNAAMGGFAAAIGMERLFARLTMAAGSLGSVVATARKLPWHEPSAWAHVLLAQWWLLSGLGFALLAVLVRVVLRWRLRAKFRGGLGPTLTARAADALLARVHASEGHREQPATDQ